MKKIILLLFGILFFLLSQKVSASSDFTTSFDVQYTITESGIAHAVFQGTLTNTVDNKFASLYTLRTGFSDMENIQASDPVGVLTPTQDGQVIKLSFRDHVVGVGKSLPFTIAFDTQDIARHNGNIWEINIPGIANQEDFKQFTVHLVVPNSFGQVAYIKPITAGSSLDFDKSTLGSSGISLAFGQSQTYAFSLLYHLQNTNFFPIKTHIALPPTTNYQSVSLTSLSPKPDNVELDKDGNWIATYSLASSQKITVTAKGTVGVSLIPLQQELSTTDKALYLQEQPYWQTSDGEIKKLSQDLKTPQEIFQYVVNHLSYDFSRVAGTQIRLGAAAVLKKPTSAVCLEFTDLFVALARAAGIPAREVDGFAFTQNQLERPLSEGKDILHAWPEYYDFEKRTWIMVDPTWQNTTRGVDYFSLLDFDHVAFAIKGVRSEVPLPAGGYKLPTDTHTKDVSVTFAESAEEQPQQAGVDFTTAKTILSGFPLEGTLFMKNAGTQLIESQKVTISSPDFSPHTQTFTTQAVPPYGYILQTIGFDKVPFLTNGTKTITIQVAGNTIKKSVRVYPFFFQKEYIIGGISFVILCIIVLIIAARAWRISVPR